MITPLPKQMETVNEGDAFVIRRKWLTPKAYFLLFFSIIWNGFMIVWMGISITQGEWMMALFGSIHATVGIGLIYTTAAQFLNTTDISVTPESLTVRHYPILWPGNKQIPIHTIKQLYCKRHVSNGEDGDTITYRVHLLTQDNKDQKLITGLEDDSQARYIEEEIENILGLEDLKVNGELYKSGA